MALHSIRRIYDHTSHYNQAALEQCRAILLSQFPYLKEKEADELLNAADRSTNRHFKHMVLVAQKRNKQVIGVAFASHFSKENFIFLDFIATLKGASGGVGGALYERLREEAAAMSAKGIFFDCLPDNPEWCTEAEKKQNVARLRFYEKFGATPLEGSKYEMPRSDGTVFHLMFDGLGRHSELEMAYARRVMRLILENKAAGKCTSDYMLKVILSVKSNLKQRPLKYQKNAEVQPVRKGLPADKKVALVVNEGHQIHHVRERGYLESPVRVSTIEKELDKLPVFEKTAAKSFADRHLEEVHRKEYLKFLKAVCEKIGDKTSKYGDVFPIRNTTRLPGDIELQIGYYCIDTSTPLNANAYKASRAAVNCALTAADMVLHGRQLAYALVRPPGHHAERGHFGGFCYLNSSAIAANYLSKHGRVALLDIDYHHGNGQQDIFYHRNDVFTVSVHADPEYAYPNFTGFADETGQGAGEGFNLNITLPQQTNGVQYHKALKRAIKAIADYQPAFLVIALGLDIAKGDPTGTWSLSTDDFVENGKLLAGMSLPTLVVQEGGYKNRMLGVNARKFFQGLWDGYYLGK